MTDALAKPGSEAQVAERPLALPRDEAERWRLELERAQLAQRASCSHVQPGTRAFQAPAPARSPLPRVPAMQTPAQAAGSAARPSAPSLSAADAAAPARAAAEPRCPSSAASAQPLYALGECAPRSDGAGGADAAAPAAPRPQKPVGDWLQVNAHAYVDGESAAVWVRDASLAEEERAALALRLQSAMRNMGFDVQTLVINGEPVILPPTAIAGRGPSR